MNLTLVASWLQHRWCLYICWILQFPAFGSLAFMFILAAAFSSESFSSGSLSTAGVTFYTLLGLPFCLYICQPIMYFTHRLSPTRMLCMQVFESVYITFVGAPIMPGKNFWRISDYTVWTVVITCYASFYILLARSVLVWYQSRKEPKVSIALEDGEKMGDVLKDVSSV
ncbi:hypothetical protein E4T44_03687 [Aureobasidium sp. EXF-8845]|nr:hypothetical protein E4T44_03687 [Aureobasidium sp. EXF-8845]KAI4854900.1 hypothetical protein E4T45_03670 [Aureobasidium sp. EXF-8846]